MYIRSARGNTSTITFVARIGLCLRRRTTAAHNLERIASMDGGRSSWPRIRRRRRIDERRPRRRHALLLLALPAAVAPLSAPSARRRIVTRHDLPLRGHRPSNFEEEDASSDVGLYVHIPYCRRRCHYCDFAIVPVGSTKADGDATRRAGFERMDEEYRRAVLREIEAIGRSTPGRVRLGSMYFGGGTPSLAPLSTLRSIVRALVASDAAPFCLEDGAEITVEMDPGTFDLSYLAAMKEMGFNRISLGVQGFDDDVLAAMGRAHRVQDVYDSVEMIGKVFGEDANYSVDLISGAPGLTLAGWAAALQKAGRLRPGPSHMSLYDLQVEEGTAFGRWYGDAADAEEGANASQSPRSRPALPSAADRAFMYSYASGYLRARGHEHYEISSYAVRTGDGASPSLRRSRHNQVYWRHDGEWHAVGLGATSSVGGTRFARPRALSDYVAWTAGLERCSGVGAGPAENPPWLRSKPSGVEDSTGEDDELVDVVMTRLRTSDGLDLDWVAGRGDNGEANVEAILRGFDLALELDLGTRESGHGGKHGCIRLNDPRGFLFSNDIISSIFAELSGVGP